MGAIEIYDDKSGFRKRKASKRKDESGFKSTTPTEYEKLLNDLYSVLPKLTHHQFKHIKRIIHKQFLTKFARNQPPKYGSLNKGFTEKEVQVFFRTVDSQKLLLLFQYQAQLGLRIGEAVRVNVKDIDFDNRELRIRTEKAHTLNTLIIPIPLFKQTLEYIRQYERHIQKDGYLFFKEEGKYSHRDEPYLSTDYVRNSFRYYVQRAGLDEVYDSSDETNYSRTPRRLHRLTTHSLRHYAITSFAKQTNGNVVLTSKFARHRSTGVTQTYISTTKQELYREIDNTFSVDQADRLKKRLIYRS